MNTPQRVVLLLSGGLDSALSLAELLSRPLEEVERVHALIFDYGQSSLKEIECAVLLCEQWGVPYTVQFPMLMQQDTAKEIPARNLIFLSHAAAFAMGMGFNTIALGAEPDSTYTDSSVMFLSEARRLLGTQFNLAVIAPVKFLQNKLALVLRALELGVPLHLCHSSRTQEVDGKCKTSSLFLQSLGQVFPQFLTPVEMLQELARIRLVRGNNVVHVHYQEGRTFKYPAALFSVMGRAEFLTDAHINVFSTGSWMDDLCAVSLLPQVKSRCKASLCFHKTTYIPKLLNQALNCDSKWAQWGLKQALSLLRRPRYSRHIACQQTQGHLATALESLGYIVERPAQRTGLLLQTALLEEGTK